MHPLHKMRATATDGVAWSVSVCLCVCLLVTKTSHAKTAEPIEMQFGTLTHVSTRNHASDGSQGRMNPFTAVRGDNMAMRPFVKIL